MHEPRGHMAGTNGELKKLQLQMLRTQQGIFHRKERLMIVFEGVDAAGKGGVIRRLTEKLDPRGFQVHPIAAPTADEQGKHYLYRFWNKIPSPGMISIFDRSWYGRVLVERVEELTPKERWQQAYQEINEFERQLSDDGVMILKFYLKISKEEQLKRFEARLNDPYKQWKITEEDIRNRAKWNLYEKAKEQMIKETSSSQCPWILIETDSKDEARLSILELINKKCSPSRKWMEERSHLLNHEDIKKSLKALEQT